MALVPCESCRRHVRVTEEACPFCKAVRAGTKAVAVATSIFALTGCGETFSPAAKYGGPPAQPDVPTATVTVTEAGPPAPATSAPEAGPPSSATTDTPDASPRLGATDGGPPGRKFAPVALYGAPPRHKTTPK